MYLQNFFEDVRVQLEADLARRGIELVMDVQERGTARFDEGKMLRVIHNLARNAARSDGRWAKAVRWSSRSRATRKAVSWS